MLAADEDILSTFRKEFGPFVDEPIILYGVGEKTKLIVENLHEFNFVGIMDKNSAGYPLYGVDVVNHGEAVKRTKTIIVVANYSNAGIIYKRISDLEATFGISIYHMNGEKLVGKESLESHSVTNRSLSDLLAKIDENQIISFDIFDTLISRAVLYPSDVFAIVEKESNLEHFVAARIEAEKQAFKKFGDRTTIDDIYTCLAPTGSHFPMPISELKELEICTEKKILSVREDILFAYNYARRQKKRILFTSDMYLPPDVLSDILSTLGVPDGYELVVSCDTGKSKYAGSLWAHLAEKYSTTNFLHVGDDNYADIEQAQRNGFATFKVPSWTEMTKETRFSKVVNNGATLTERLVLGRHFSKLLNSPFSFSDGTPTVSTMFDIGYLFYGPLIYNYLNWLISSCKIQGLNKILFVARDCYLLESLFKERNITNIDGIYFYASRRAVAVPSIRNRKDIENVFNVFYLCRKIPFSKFFETAFGISLLPTDTFSEKHMSELDKETLLDHITTNYEDAILDNSQKEYEGYQEYARQIGLTSDDKVAVVNFVSRGVTQHFIEKLFPKFDMSFYYFLTQTDMKDMEVDAKKVFSLYGTYLSPYTTKKSALIRHFMTAEAIFCSPENQFVKFENGGKIFSSAGRKHGFSTIEDCHAGIRQFVDDMESTNKAFHPKICNADMIDELFGLQFDADLVNVTTDVKENFSITEDYAPNGVLTGLW